MSEPVGPPTAADRPRLPVGENAAGGDTPANPSRVPEEGALTIDVFPFVLAGRYVVERELGRGGMGQVLLARDQRLKGRIAIKLLPLRIGSERELQRLEREAQLIGSLGHPNVVEVHDLGSFEGRPFIVEELLEGVTLRERLTQRPLPLEQTLDIAAQVARGLAAAHDRSLVHCDVKPENVFIGKDARVKILDFGIARATAVQPAPASSTDVERSTSTPPVFAGTPAYSSPEQLRCGTVDHRSDIFSLGAVLYEMLAGQRAFERGTILEAASAVLNSAPLPLPERIPADVRRIVWRCLDKNPDRRFQSAKDLAFQLEGVAARLTLPRRARRFVTVALAIACIATIIAAALLGARQRRSVPPSHRQISFLPGAVWTARFGPDGREVFFTEAFDGSPPRVYTTRTGSTEYQRLDLRDAVLLGVSARGQLAVLSNPQFRGSDYFGTLAVVSPAGGAPRELLENVDSADWAPDGSMLAVTRRVGGQQRLEYPAGTVLFQTTGWVSRPRVSPSGDRVAFLHHPELTSPRGAVVVVDRLARITTLAGGWDEVTGAAWSPDGSEVWFSASAPDPPGAPAALRAVSLDGKQRLLSQTSGDLKLDDVSRDGAVLVTTPQRYVGIAAFNGGRERDLSIRDEQMLQDLSRDGSQILFTINPRTPDGEGLLFVRNTDGSPPVQLASGYGGALTPDGKWALIFPADSSARPLSLVPTGHGAARTLQHVALAVSWATFFPDGRRALLVGQEPAKATRLYEFTLEGGSLRAISEEGVNPWHAAVSPNGHLVAGTDARARVTLYSPDGADPVPVAEATPGEIPYGWTSDGALLVGRPLEPVAEIHRIDLRAHRRASWKIIRPTAPGAYAVRKVFISPDKETFAYSYISWKTHLYLLEGVH